MPSPERRTRRSLTRAGLPADLTPDTLRHLGLDTLRQLSRPGNGVLDAEDQRRFDAALAEVTRGTAAVLDESLRRADHGGPANLDPALRRSYVRAQRLLAGQARRGRDSLPGVAPGPAQPGTYPDKPDPDKTYPDKTRPDTHTDETRPDETRPDETRPDETGPESAAPSTEAPPEDVSPDALVQQIEQTSDTLDMLERIASLQQQQVEHQHRQLLSDTRGFLFAFLVSVAVIVAGVAPLVEADAHDRWLIVLWTVVATAAAGIVYYLVRTVQSKK